MIHNKLKNEITLIEIGITNQDLLVSVEMEKTRKYDLLANKLSQLNQCKVKIIPYVLTWDGIVTKYHKKYIKELEISPEIEAYIQSKVLKCTLESISFDYRQGREEKLEEKSPYQGEDSKLARQGSLKM